MRYFRSRIQKHVTTGLMILFLALALVPIYQILARFAPNGHFVQLCSAMGIQTVWVADDADGRLPALTASSVGASAQSDANGNQGALNLSGSLSSPFGSCEFCWASALATVLPLAIVLFFGQPERQFAQPVARPFSFQSFVRQWHARPRAPPYAFLIA